MAKRWPPAQPAAPPARPRDAQRNTPQPGTVPARINAVETAAPPQQNNTPPEPIATSTTQGTVAGRVLALNRQGAPAEAWARNARAALEPLDGEDRTRNQARLVEHDAHDDDTLALNQSGREDSPGMNLQQRRTAAVGNWISILAVCMLFFSFCFLGVRSVGSGAWSLFSFSSLVLAWLGCLFMGALLLLIHDPLRGRQ